VVGAKVPVLLARPGARVTFRTRTRPAYRPAVTHAWSRR